MVDYEVLRLERRMGGDFFGKGIGLPDLVKGDDKRKRLGGLFPTLRVTLRMTPI